MVAETAARFAGQRPQLDQVSRTALDRPPDPAAHDVDDLPDDPVGDPETALLAALAVAPDEGISVPALVAQTGMSRRWIYCRLHELAGAGVVIQTARGHWRSAGPGQ
jgi:S-DNA-T family DNA segregation ATPase FtsK/SpoIIIE